jgi:hypothetical protein
LRNRAKRSIIAHMADFDVRCDVSKQVEGLEKMLGDDLPFTIARFLTLEAQSGQAAARTKAAGVFRLRNDWTVQNIRITPAKKTSLFAEVFTDTSNRKTGAPDYLPRQQDGGDRVPLQGKHYLAVPTRYLWKYTPKSRPIPDNLRPSALLPPGMKIGESYAGKFSSGSRAAGTKRVVSKGTLKKLSSSEYEAFVQRTHTGTLCIFVRHGGIGWHGDSQDAEPWYVLATHATITARFPMELVVQQAVASNADANFNKAAAEVLVNRALGSGFGVRF